MGDAMQILREYFEEIDYYSSKVPMIKDISNKVNKQPGTVAMTIGGLFSFCMIFGLWSGLLCDSIGMIYPAYMTCKTIQNGKPADKKQWTTYWVIFAVFKLFDCVPKVILNAIPLYETVKFIILVLMMHPDVKLASTVYMVSIKPLFKRHKMEINMKSSENSDKRFMTNVPKY